MREERLASVPKLRDMASRGERPKKQYEYAGIGATTYYRWLQETPQLRDELAQLLTDFRRAKIKEAALIGAPISEQRLHANKLTEKEYDDIMQADPDFAEEIEMTRECNLKLWARRNIAESIQTNRNVSDSWRYLEHMEKEMNKTRIEVSEPTEEDDEDEALLNEYEEKIRQNIQKRIRAKVSTTH